MSSFNHCGPMLRRVAYLRSTSWVNNLKFFRKRSGPLNTEFFQMRHYTPRRALLYSPGDDLKKLCKALSLDVDCVIMDCEDGVAVSRKDAARTTIRSILQEGLASVKCREWSVRVNSVDSTLCADDLLAILTGSVIPPTILLPKVDKIEHVEWFADQVYSHLKKFNSEKRINLIMYIESAEAVLNMHSICEKARQLSASHPIVPVGLVFGSDDLCASLGAARSEDAAEMMYIRQKLVVVAKAFDLQAIDMVHIKFKDLDGLKNQSELGAQLGYTGKQCIHPVQVPVIQAAFLPSKEKTDWAKGLVAAFHSHQKAGKGAFVYEGHMIDMPLLRQAQNILQLIESTKSHDASE